MEACEILGITDLPRVHILQQSAPRVYLLTVPDAWAPAPTSNGSSKGRGGGGGNAASSFAWRRQGLLVVTRGALQLLAPLELQAALGAALLPLRAPGDERPFLTFQPSISLTH
jgi:hypothetical protein